MSVRARPLVVALAAALVLFVAVSKETWVAIPIVAAAVVTLLSRSHALGRGTMVMALVVIASITFIVLGSAIALLSFAARTTAGIALASGLATIALGSIGLILGGRSLRRAMRSTRIETAAANERVSSP